MQLSCTFEPLPLHAIRREFAFLKAEDWRFVQMLATVSDVDGNDLYYSFMKDGELRNYVIAAVPTSKEVPSISDLFLAAFVFENEARELFGVNMTQIAIDFSGALYAPAVDEPMRYLSPEQKEALDKLKAVNAAKAAKAGEDGSSNQNSTSQAGSSSAKRLTAAQRDLIKKKIAELPEKHAAMLQAVLDRDDMQEDVRSEAQNTASKVEGNTPNAVVGDAPVVKAEHEVVVNSARETNEPIAQRIADEALDKMLSLMDEDRAKVVLDALHGERV